MASQDTVPNDKPSVYNLMKEKQCLNDRPIISQTANQPASPARPPVAAKPRRKPPAPSPKPCKPCPPPPPPQPAIPCHQPSQPSPSSKPPPSPQTPQSKQEEQNHDKSEKQNDEKSSLQADAVPGGRCQNTTQCDAGHIVSTNPFEEETDVSPSTNPFEEEETDNEPTCNPFEEEQGTGSSSNPFESERETEISPDQAAQTEITACRRSSQPPPLPTSPPSKARLSRSLSGIKVSASQNKNDLISPNVKVSVSSSNLSQSDHVTTSTPHILQSSSSSSSLNVISASSPNIAQPPAGKSPPTVRPKPSPPCPRSPAANVMNKNQSSSPNPPPRSSKAAKVPAVSATSSPFTSKLNSETKSTEHTKSLSISPTPLTSNLPQKTDNRAKLKGKAGATPPPVPKKSPKHVPKPKPSSVSNDKRNSPQPPSIKSQSPPPSTATAEDESLDGKVLIPQTPKSHQEEEKDLAKATPTPLSSSPPPSSPPLHHDISQTPPAPPNPDPPESTDEPVIKTSGGNEESQNVSGAHVKTENKLQVSVEGKEPDKKKVPPPLPKNPPRGRPLRRSVSGPTSQPDGPPPPPPRAPPISSSLRSQSLQDESLTKDSGSGDREVEPLVNQIGPEATDHSGSSSPHPVAPVRQSKESSNKDASKKESESRKLLDKAVESDAHNKLINSPSINSISEEIVSEGVELSVESADKSTPVINGPPRPVPRKRLSRNSVELSKDLQEQPSQVVDSELDSQPKKEKATVVFEHEYSEVYRGDSPERTSVPENPSSSSSATHQVCSKPDTDYDDHSSNSNREKDLDQNVGESSRSNDNSIISNRSSNSNTDSTLSKDEPEATCDMLKEIEELLRNKLGVSDESALISLSNDSIDLRFSGKGSDYDFDPEEQTEGEDEPVRPPRPKRDASLNRENSESLSNVNSPKSDRRRLSGSHVGSADGKKSAPPKPKRSTLPRIGRSLSDVTGSKSPFDGFSDDSTSASSPPDICKSAADDNEARPQLPPRNESLRKGGLYQSRQQVKASPSSTSDIETPPPLPPRNKPRSASMNEGSSKSDASPPKPVLSANPAASKDDDTIKRRSKMATRRSDLSDFTKGALPKSLTSGQGGGAGTGRSPAPRPARKAPPPPPPPNVKQRSTTGPADKRSPMSTPVVRRQDIGNKSPQQSSREASPLKSTPKTSSAPMTSTPRVKKARSIFHKFSSNKKPEESQWYPQESEQDVEYHEISDP